MEMSTDYEIIKQLAKDVAFLEQRCADLERQNREKDAAIHTLVSLLAANAQGADTSADA